MIFNECNVPKIVRRLPSLVRMEAGVLLAQGVTDLEVPQSKDREGRLFLYQGIRLVD